jgi:hypothetical protein
MNRPSGRICPASQEIRLLSSYHRPAKFPHFRLERQRHYFAEHDRFAAFRGHQCAEMALRSTGNLVVDPFRACASGRRTFRSRQRQRKISSLENRQKMGDEGLEPPTSAV